MTFASNEEDSGTVYMRPQASYAGPSISMTSAAFVNVAFHQNAIPIISDLSVSLDEGAGEIREAVLHIEADPPFLRKKEWKIDRLIPGNTLRISDIDIPLDQVFLANLTEAYRSRVMITLTHGDFTLAENTFDIRLLAPDEWGGLASLPEILAAFVRPNDSAIEVLLKKASDALHASGKVASIDGYLSGKRERAWELAAGIWSAVISLAIDYAVPPASFESSGQKVRSPGHITEHRLATCLDLTLFFAAALEQAGLNPLIILEKDHAYVGCWLTKQDFSTAVIYDPLEIRKRLQLGELMLFETTLAAQRSPTGFRTACERGADHIAESEDSSFVVAIDIRRARQKRILPLVQPGTGQCQSEADVREPGAPPPIEEAPDFTDLPAFLIPPPELEETSSARLERWKTRLLDLSLRNRFLNFKPSAKSIPLVCPIPTILLKSLADGKEIKLLAKPDLMSGNDPRDGAIYLSRHGDDPGREFAIEALKRNEAVAEVPENDLDTRLLELYRTAQQNLEEGGANVLYLVIGFLRWTQQAKDSAKKAARAPLIMVPVTLDRRSARSGFRLKSHEDEVRFNSTLLQMLKQDTDLDLHFLEKDLPKAGDVVDIAAIWRVVRSAILEIPGWEVTEEVVLSTFSFTKYLMWKDLVDRTEDLKRSPIVQHLIETPKDRYSNSGSHESNRELDDTPPDELLCPLPSDSSQSMAVLASGQGEDFVLLGPPGTGKSQTIANMIAHNLGLGRTVLFVSEKIAALGVVHRRLKEIGLDEFCLELHSNKAKKTEIIEQLRFALEARTDGNLSDWSRDSTRLMKLRAELNSYVKRLHHEYPNGSTPYRAMGIIAKYQNEPFVRLSWPDPDTHNQDFLDILTEATDRLSANAGALGTVAHHPLREIGHHKWSPEWQTNLAEAVGAAEVSLTNLDQACSGFAEILGLAKPTSRSGWEALSLLAEILPKGSRRGFALSSDAEDIVEALETSATAIDNYSSHKSNLSIRYSQAAEELDHAALLDAWTEAEPAWWMARRARQRKIIATLKNAGSGRPKNPSGDLDLLDKMAAKRAEIERVSDVCRNVGSLWKGLDSDTATLRETAEWCRSIRLATAALTQDPMAMVDLRARIAAILDQGGDLLRPEAVIGRSAGRLSLAAMAWRKAEADLAAVADPQEIISDDGWFTEQQERLTAWLTAANRLRDWCGWRSARVHAVALGLELLVEAVESGAVKPEMIRQNLEVNYARWWTSIVFGRDEVLRNFVSAEHEKRIELFKELDKKIADLVRSVVRARLASDDFEDNGEHAAEFGVLKREFAKKRQHMPLRQLISKLPNTLTKLTPCVLMSPLSISQYLASDAPPFDVVIFDEASQIAVWDAIGAIARGKQTIVVGDPKQLPPTNFFDRNDEDPTPEDEEDLESILDELIGARVPTKELRWHYRSRHESLITFSNHRYYDGKLVTFPSPVVTDRAVAYRHVPGGIYERGKNRVNRAEAQAVVAEAVTRFKDPFFRETHQSLGIVTFNAEQQRLIEDLLDAERRRDPSLEPFFSKELVEPVAVKNLESVQGDERDIILFSIGYGPDAAGKHSLNFGPLNKLGGPRRLNVAITRARRELIVFGTLRAQDIDLSRTNSEGVRDFKHFLEFAERGVGALARAIQSVGGDYESPFESAVAEALASKGWSTHAQIGVSEFRIDLGIVHPDRPAEFLAGIECDGATYHRAATARDRDRLREMILTGLGWKIVRIWSTDWWTSRGDALEEVHNKLTAILEADRAPSKSETQPDTKIEQEAASDLTYVDDDAPEAENPSEPVNSTAEARPLGLSNDTYRIGDISEIAGGPNEILFYENTYDHRLKTMIEHIIEVEAPLHLNALVRRIARAHGFERAGPKIRERVIKLLPPTGSCPAAWCNIGLITAFSGQSGRLIKRPRRTA